MSSSPSHQIPAASPQITQNLLMTLLTSPPTPILWILGSVVVSMTILRYTVFPCLTVHGLEQAIKAVDKLLQGHIGLGIIPSNFDSSAGGQRDLGLLDCNEHPLRSDQLGSPSLYLDIGDLERSHQIKDVAHDLRLQPPPPSLTSYLKIVLVDGLTLKEVGVEI
ncbi:hypothetical protein BDP27DRAFT_1361940 [Rhodocollybia butyracea]|uniref:Uncharacterized protein n=1 Tax=Rhodocollybia butyracea TaxID=206335 RepID=A0A9P5U9V5_9AGAR|nr:hypothetical protein BDP27DRAFT_1361940 [Rhodocollybia butyracea]